MANDNTIPNRLQYEDPDYPVAVVYKTLAHANNENIVWEWHEDVKIIIINNGAAQINTDDSSIQLLPGQAILIGRNVMHSIHRFGEEPCSFYSITFHGDFTLGPDGNTIRRKFVEILDKNEIRVIVFNENMPWHSELIDYINAAITANLLKSPGYRVATRGYLCLVSSILIEHVNDKSMGDAQIAPASMDEQRVKQAMSFIRTNYSEKITLDDIANYIHISKGECCRCFKRSIGMSPFEYLMKYRISEAANKLKDPTYASESIADIAISVGFNNLSYFSKLFNKYMNLTPRNYRNDSSHHNPSSDLMSLR